eukprot:Platyproteum_vivax@DN967_c0_g1_i1.p1
MFKDPSYIGNKTTWMNEFYKLITTPISDIEDSRKATWLHNEETTQALLHPSMSSDVLVSSSSCTLPTVASSINTELSDATNREERKGENVIKVCRKEREKERNQVLKYHLEELKLKKSAKVGDPARSASAKQLRSQSVIPIVCQDKNKHQNVQINEDRTDLYFGFEAKLAKQDEDKRRLITRVEKQEKYIRELERKMLKLYNKSKGNLNKEMVTSQEQRFEADTVNKSLRPTGGWLECESNCKAPICDLSPASKSTKHTPLSEFLLKMESPTYQSDSKSSEQFEVKQPKTNTKTESRHKNRLVTPDSRMKKKRQFAASIIARSNNGYESSTDSETSETTFNQKKYRFPSCSENLLENETTCMPMPGKNVLILDSLGKPDHNIARNFIIRNSPSRSCQMEERKEEFGSDIWSKWKCIASDLDACVQKLAVERGCMPSESQTKTLTFQNAKESVKSPHIVKHNFAHNQTNEIFTPVATKETTALPLKLVDQNEHQNVCLKCYKLKKTSLEIADGINRFRGYSSTSNFAQSCEREQPSKRGEIDSSGCFHNASCNDPLIHWPLTQVVRSFPNKRVFKLK